MGISFSCPFAKCSHVEDGLDLLIEKSINFGNDEIKTPMLSVSFKNEDLEPTILKSLGSGKMTIEACVGFKRKDMENIISSKTLAFDKEKHMTVSRINKKIKGIDDQSLRSECQMEKIQSALLDLNNHKHTAALKLQKVYKSFRTRRKLADCAILVEQSWWKLLDFAELKRSSISFFDIEKHESAISRWSRARTRAAKVGKGLSKDDKAQKLALQHWLEAIDPRHRYGHNLHFYYDRWLKCQSREPFFYWLDIGEGKEVNLEKCPRSKLQQQCIKYLGPMERLSYEVVVVDGRFFYKQSGELLHTTGEGAHAKWIFVLSTSKTLYVGRKKKGSFQHSSFLAGGATSCAGRLVVEYGMLKSVWPHSGHYRPTAENFKEFILFLQDNNVDLSDVKMTPVEEEEDDLCSSKNRGHLRSHSYEEDLTENMSDLDAEEISVEEKANLMETENASVSALVAPKIRQFQIFGRELTNLEIPKRNQMIQGLDNEKACAKQSNESFQMDSPTGGQETAQALASELDHTFPKQNISDEKHDVSDVETIPEESILKKLISHKEMKSYQLGKQLSCKWTTGAGPRIGFVRDYPCKLQYLALEQANLSPTSDCRSKSSFAPRTTTGPWLRLECQHQSQKYQAKVETRSMPQGVEHKSRSESSMLVRGRSVIPIIRMS
ncbi:IQ domain-containing protein IQM2-like [Gastrolobium bilobum]|uniref:IQ domain-containing protein IQM2-like n=1 Tax=Gastrolobium bilobum TaxID=150636 RepID=UPI002AB23E60|nr:IQ domain-containing protein IQM2-like [Gastrolobium bilobum]